MYGNGAVLNCGALLTNKGLFVKLRAPDSYYQATPDEMREVVNGCGPESWKFKLDKTLGVNLFEACAIHDWRYELGGNKHDRKKADQEFILNCVVIAMLQSVPHLLWRMPLILLAYAFVRVGGRKNFKWADR